MSDEPVDLWTDPTTGARWFTFESPRYAGDQAEPMTDAMKAVIQMLIEDTNTKPEKMAAHYGLNQWTDGTRGQADDMVKQLNKKLAKQQGQKT